jgi:3-phenylpropionate/cinnamic acid dioxygenase small subunit
MSERALADQASIRRLLALYCQLCDDGRFAEWAELFTEDATFTVMGQTHTGRAELQAFMATAQPPEARGKHCTFEPVIELSGDEGRAWTDYVFVGRVGQQGRLGVTSAGRYHDHLRCEDGVWRFAAREIVFLGEATDDLSSGLLRTL